jgi:uncharacterized membrane protein (UPF0136 family)
VYLLDASVGFRRWFERKGVPMSLIAILVLIAIIALVVYIVRRVA